MPLFNFRAFNQQGAAINGQRVAHSSAGLAQQLTAEGLTPVDINEHRYQLSYRQRLFQVCFVRGIPLEMLILLCRQLHSLHKAGIPILTAINRLAETATHLGLRRILANVAEQLSAGQTLTQALKKHQHALPPLFINIIHIGEQTGHLEDALKQLYEYLSLEEKTLRRFKTTLRYPSFVLTAIIGAMLIINGVVIPTFARIFADYQASLPLFTRILIATAQFTHQHGLLLLIAMILTAITVFRYAKTPVGRKQWHRLQLRLPIIGSILERILLARFARSFALIHRSGLTVTEGLDLCAKAISNVYLSDYIQQMQTAITRGETLTQAANQIPLLSPLVLQMIAVGEETGNIADMLDEVGDFYESEVDFELTRLNDRIEPLLLLILGSMVLVLALAVFLPMWNMVRLVHAG